MLKVAALDLETVCDVKGCPGYNKSDNTCTDEFGKKLRQAHALNPWKNRITQVGIWSPEKHDVYSADTIKHGLDIDYKDYRFVGHRFKFDVLVLWAHDIDFPIDRWLDCTRLMAHVCTDKVDVEWLEQYNLERKDLNKALPTGISHREGKIHSLKVLAPYFLDVEPFWEDPTNHDNSEYVLKDCEYTYRLWEFLWQRLEDNGELDFYTNKVIHWDKMLARAEYRGIRIDLDKMTELESTDKIEREKIEKELSIKWAIALVDFKDFKIDKALLRYHELEQAQVAKTPDTQKQKKVLYRYEKLFQTHIAKLEEDGELNLKFSSDSDMMWLFRDYFKYNVQDYKSKDSTGDEVLERLSAEYPDKGIDIYLKWRKVTKRLTSYYPSYRRLQVDGILHTSFDSAGPKTGRLSSSNPNLQQVPPELKCLFIPRPGYKLISMDEEGIEGRLIALYTEDPTLCSIIDKDMSLHNWNAKSMMELDVDVMDVKAKFPKERQAAKRCGFALFYGAGAKRIKGAFLSEGFKLSQGQCKKIHENVKNTFPEVFTYHEEVTRLLGKGNVFSNLLGRPVKMQPSDNVYMQGFNKIIQGSASDLVLDSGCNMEYSWIKDDVPAYPVLFIHDDIWVEVLDTEAEKCYGDMEFYMTDYVLENKLGRIPLKVEGKVIDGRS